MAVDTTAGAGVTCFIRTHCESYHITGDNSCGDSEDGITSKNHDGGEKLPERGLGCDIAKAKCSNGDNGIVNAYWDIGERGVVLTSLNNKHERAGNHREN